MQATMALPAELTIYGVAELRDHLLAWMATPHEAAAARVLDGQSVDDVDAAGLQLLVSLSRTAEGAGTPLRIDVPSDALRRAAEALGVAQALGLATSSVPSQESQP